MILNWVHTKLPSTAGNRVLRLVDQKYEFDIQKTVHRDYSYNKSQRDALFLKFILVKNSTYFGQIYCPSSGVSTLYTQQKLYVRVVMLTVC
jgi:hypothetical protein